MKVEITYKLKNGEERKKWFIRDTMRQAIMFFNWRYNHTIIDVQELKGI